MFHRYFANQYAACLPFREKRACLGVHITQIAVLFVIRQVQVLWLHKEV